MTFLERVLDPPAYGFERNGKFYVPTNKEIFREFFSRINIFKSKKNWLPFFSWLTALILVPVFFLFVFHYFTFPLFVIAFFYSMVILGSHGTFWLHRYGTHRAYQYRNKFVRMICRNLTIRIVPEEVYIISHHVHHQLSEQPGDPYNVHAGFLYCFLADANHQGIRKDLSEKEYTQLCKLMNHTGVHLNTYQQYQTWGSITNPFYAIAHYIANWGFWFGAFYLMGGIPLAVTIFAATGFWAFGVRTFNYDGHGRGKDTRKDGIDFNRRDLSVNQTWPGYVSGEWHNNHHLYPNSANNWFLPYQLDLPWLLIQGLHKVGVITCYKNDRDKFMKFYYEPYLKNRDLAIHAGNEKILDTVSPALIEGETISADGVIS